MAGPAHDGRHVAHRPQAPGDISNIAPSMAHRDPLTGIEFRAERQRSQGAMSQTTFTAAPAAASPLGEPLRLFSAPFLILNVSALFSAVSFSAMLPVTTLLVSVQLGGGDVAIGFVIGVFAVTAIAARPTIGRLGDSRGRRYLIVVGSLATALTFAAHAWADTYLVLLVMRLLTGGFQGAFFVGSAALVSDLAPEHRRGEALSWFSVSIYLGMSLGPWFGVAVNDWAETWSPLGGFDTAFLVAGGLMLVGALVARLLPNDSPGEVPHRNQGDPEPPVNGTAGALALRERLAAAARPMVFELVGRHGRSSSLPGPLESSAPAASQHAGRIFYKPALWPGVVLAMGIIIFPALWGFLPKIAEQQGWSSDFIGSIFFIYGILVLVLRVIGRKLPDQLGTKRTATLALIGATVGMAVMGTFVSQAGFYIGTVILALGGSLLYPALMVAAVDGVPPNERAQAVSTFTMFFELSAGIGGPILGVTAWMVGATVGAFYASATMSAIGIVLLWIWQRGLASSSR
ncbi:MAG: MFS transporter [Acidimicrobiales bacterium]|nr:MFS transporter [Acidimicrobiales bacterium]MYG88530.1 MFS transporter [Acidimicrobiales bacterium]MYI27661.1 MFS transporter [Acidimicrobiales bacterium]